MPLHPNNPAPERILVYGPAGTSKTTGFLNIARMSQATQSPSRFYVLDSDFAMDRMLTGYPELTFSIFGDANYSNPDSRLHIFPVFDWRDYERAIREIQLRAKPHDWVSVDFISTAWTAVQEHYVNEVFHQDIGQYFLKVRKDLDKDAKSLGALEGWVDWQVINPLYRKWVNTLLYRGRYHVYATAKADNLSSDRNPTENAQVRQLFLRFQSKPVGQKDLPFQFHTVLLTGRRDNNWTLTTVKDRERFEASSLTVRNFTNDYLVDIAGWSLT